MSDYIIFEALSVFAIWMQRKHRWKIFWEAASGKYTVAGAPNAASPAFSQAPQGNGFVIPNGSGGSSTIPGNTNPALGNPNDPNSLGNAEKKLGF